jgi:hypothetical protein
LSFTVKFYAQIATGGISVLVLIRFPYEVVNGSSSKEVEPGTSIQQEIKSIPGIISKNSRLYLPQRRHGSSQVHPSVIRNILCENTFFLGVRDA